MSLGNPLTSIKKPYPKNVHPVDHTKKIRLTIYNNKFKTSNLIISHKSSPSTELLDRANVVYMSPTKIIHTHIYIYIYIL